MNLHYSFIVAFIKYMGHISGHEYSGNACGNNIYNDVYKQPSRKKCALLPMDSIKKIIGDEE